MLLTLTFGCLVYVSSGSDIAQICTLLHYGLSNECKNVFFRQTVGVILLLMQSERRSIAVKVIVARSCYPRPQSPATTRVCWR